MRLKRPYVASLDEVRITREEAGRSSMPPRHALLASMGLPVGSRFIELSLFTRCSAGRDMLAVLQEARGERS